MPECIVLDTETTSVDTDTARVVTAFVGVFDTDTGTFTESLEFLVNPGIPIPEEASAVHGITNEVAATGMAPEEFLEILFDFLHKHADLPLVVMNANYDLSLINSELERYGVPAYDWGKRQIIDPLVIDRGNDRYRKGSRKLVNLAEHYGVPYDAESAHDAAYDCYLAGSVAGKLIEKYGLPTNDQQANWYETWRSNFESYLQRTNPDAKVDAGWPTRLKEEA